MRFIGVRCAVTCWFLGLVISGSTECHAQQSKSATPGQSAKKPKSGSNLFRQKANALLNECNDSISQIDDLFYRAKLEAMVADSFWQSDPERARYLFHKAWDLAKRSDEADTEELREKHGSADDAPSTYARHEILEDIAARDPKLAAKLADDMFAQTGRNDNDKTSQSSSTQDPWHNASPATKERLAIAWDLVREGKIDNAVALAQTALAEGVTSDLIIFVVDLEAENAGAAGNLLFQLSLISNESGGGDVNSILLLTAPIVSPSLLAVVDSQGSFSFRTLPVASATSRIPPNVSDTILNSTVPVLMQGSAQSLTGPDKSASVGYYFAIARLLPFLRNAAPALAARLQELGGSVDSNRVGSLNGQAQLTTLGIARTSDTLNGLSDAMSHAPDNATRDKLAIRMVQTAVTNRMWDRARRSAAEVSDLSLRRACLSLIAVNEIADITHSNTDDTENDYQSVLTYLARTDAPPFAIAWGYAQVSEIVARKDGIVHAAEIVDEGEKIASEISSGSRERLAAFIVLAGASVRFNKSRTWPLVREVVRTANSIEDFRGDENSLELAKIGPDPDDALEIDARAFRVDALFEKLGRFDFDEATVQAHGFNKPIPRLFALIAIARSANTK